MKEEKNTGTKVLPIILYAAEIIFLIAVAFRKYIFPPDSLFYNLYEEALSEDIFARIIKTVVILCAGSLLMKLSTMISDRSSSLTNNKAKTSALLFGNLLKYASAIAVLFLCLSTWGMDTTAIATGAGVITLILGLGCQSMIADVVAGIFLLFEGDIQVGDIVVIGGWRGTVQQIGLRRTKIVDVVGNVNIVNNSSITNIINNTKELSYAVCQVGIEYDESIERVEAVIKDNLDAMKKDIPAIVEGPFYLGVSGLDASAVTLQFVAKVKEEQKYQTEREMNRAIKILFDRNNINIPYDQLTISNRVSTSNSNTLSPEEILKAKEFIAQQREYTKNLGDLKE